MNKVKGVVLQAHIITIFRSQKLIDLQYLGTAALLPIASRCAPKVKGRLVEVFK